MEKCSEFCNACCDFCGHYNFNPGFDGEYLDNGFCKLFKVKKDPGNWCEDFKCFKLFKKRGVYG